MTVVTSVLDHSLYTLSNSGCSDKNFFFTGNPSEVRNVCRLVQTFNYSNGCCKRASF